jgi:hypothetical protein
MALVGKLILAVGFVFYGMELMATSAGISVRPFVNDLLLESLVNPWIGFFVSLVLTAVLQSSAATLAILIAMATGCTFANGGRPDLINYLPIVLRGEHRHLFHRAPGHSQGRRGRRPRRLCAPLL